MNKNMIFDLWLSEYNEQEIAEMSNLSVDNVKTMLKEYIDSMEVEEEQRYKDVWQEYYFTLEQFCKIFGESEIIYNFLSFKYEKGLKHPIFLILEEKFADNIENYLRDIELVDLTGDSIKKSVKNMFVSKEKIPENELLEIGFTTADLVAKYFAKYKLDKDAFKQVFKISELEYVYLVNRFTKGVLSFKRFCLKEPNNEYSIRYSLFEKIQNLNTKVKIKEQISDDDVIRKFKIEEDSTSRLENLYNSFDKSLETFVDKSKTIDFNKDAKMEVMKPDIMFYYKDAKMEVMKPDIMFYYKDAKMEIMKPDIMFYYKDAKMEIMKPDFSYYYKNAKTEIMKPDFSSIFENLSSKFDFVTEKKYDAIKNNRINYTSLNNLKRVHEVKPNDDQKYLSNLNNPNVSEKKKLIDQIVNINPRFSVKLSSK